MVNTRRSGTFSPETPTLKRNRKTCKVDVKVLCTLPTSHFWNRYRNNESICFSLFIVTLRIIYASLLQQDQSSDESGLEANSLPSKRRRVQFGEVPGSEKGTYDKKKRNNRQDDRPRTRTRRDVFSDPKTCTR